MERRASPPATPRESFGVCGGFPTPLEQESLKVTTAMHNT